MSILPTKPSELIRVALQDLDACKNDNKYKINMNTWHSPGVNECAVCFAGAVMAKTLGIHHTVSRNTYSFAEGTQRNLDALNMFRLGHAKAALTYLGCPAVMEDRVVVAYEDDPVTFSKQMHSMADDLQEFGV